MRSIFTLVFLIFMSLFQLNANEIKEKFLLKQNAYQYGEKIKDILLTYEKNEKNYQGIKSLFRKLLELKTDRSLEIAFEVTGYGDVHGYTYTPFELIEIIAEVIYELSRNISSEYKRISKYFDNGAARSILAKLDRFSFYDDLTKYIIENYSEKPKEQTFYGPTLTALWKLSELRDKRSIEFLQKYRSTGIREDVAIAGAYCMIPYKYEENLNYLFNLFLKYQEKDSTNLFPIDDFLVYMGKIGDPEVIPFINRYKLKGLTIDSIIPNPDSTIKNLEKVKDFIHRHYIKTSSSSILDDNNYGTLRYDSDNVLDTDNRTAWVEGVGGDGIREWFQLDFDEAFLIDGIDILSGYTKSARIFKLNNRVKEAELIFSDDSKENIQFEDTMDWQKVTFKPVETKYIRFVIKDVYKGTHYEDTCVSEIKVRGRKTEQ